MKVSRHSVRAASGRLPFATFLALSLGPVKSETACSGHAADHAAPMLRSIFSCFAASKVSALHKALGKAELFSIS
ncbi:MAG: hypothetical protein AB7I79_05185 [Rhizobiaceae bacterium]